jgi:hypothetical protein
MDNNKLIKKLVDQIEINNYLTESLNNLIENNHYSNSEVGKTIALGAAGGFGHALVSFNALNGLVFIGGVAIQPIIPLLSMIWGAVYGKIVQDRINKMHYECKFIKNPKYKKKCQLELIQYVINEMEKTLQKRDLAENYRKRIKNHLQKFKEAKRRVSNYVTDKDDAIKAGTSIFKDKNSVKEAATGGIWKGLLVSPSLMYGGVVNYRINQGHHKCNHLRDSEERQKCRKNWRNNRDKILQKYKNR